MDQYLTRRSEALDQTVRHYAARPNAMPSPGDVTAMAQAMLDFLEPPETPEETPA